MIKIKQRNEVKITMQILSILFLVAVLALPVVLSFIEK